MTYKFYGQFDLPVDQFIFTRYVGTGIIPKKCTIIECGAFDGITESSTYFFEKYFNSKVYNIEASPKIFLRLKKNRPHSINVNLALSNKSGSIEYTDVHHPGFDLCTNGSCKHTKKHLAYLDKSGCTYSNSTVNSITYSDFISKFGIKRLDLMVLDVEGYELEVLDGIKKNENVLPTVFCIEIGHLDFNTIRKKLLELGYRYDTTQDVNAYFYRISYKKHLYFKVKCLFKKLL